GGPGAGGRGGGGMGPGRALRAAFARAALGLPTAISASGLGGRASEAAVTSLRLDSQPGEPIGGGEFAYFTTEDGLIDVPPFGVATGEQVQLEFLGLPYIFGNGTPGRPAGRS